MQLTRWIQRLTQGLVMLALVLGAAAWAQAPAPSIGVVVMHGKGGSPQKWVDGLANALTQAGYRVANLSMPWSRKRSYDVDVLATVEEVNRVFGRMREQGVQKVFIAGQSQGGLFAAVYAGQARVDGLILLAPGGMVDAQGFVRRLAPDRQRAQDLMAQGRGDQIEDFNDFEGSKGLFARRTTGRIFWSWFDPNGLFTSAAFGRVRPETPTLFVAPTRDYPSLKSGKARWFAALPPHPRTRLYEPDADHMGVPSVAAPEVVRWIGEVASR